MTARHTPGPWTVKEEADSVRRIDAEDGCMIARTVEVNSRAKLHEQVPHNANLIAAAPELLEALIGLNEWAERHARPADEEWDGEDHLLWKLINSASSAIIKAEGQI